MKYVAITKRLTGSYTKADMLHRGVLQMQPIGKRLTREQHHVLKQLKNSDGFEEMNTKAFLSLMGLLHQGGPVKLGAIRADGISYSIQRIQLRNA